jgi:hypothetical protein
MFDETMGIPKKEITERCPVHRTLLTVSVTRGVPKVNVKQVNRRAAASTFWHRLWTQNCCSTNATARRRGRTTVAVLDGREFGTPSYTCCWPSSALPWLLAAAFFCPLDRSQALPIAS